jgi:membrane protease YdiL (CAAX protease family)
MFTEKGKALDFPLQRRAALVPLTLIGAFALMSIVQLLLHFAEDTLLRLPALSTSLEFVAFGWLVTHMASFGIASAYLWSTTRRNTGSFFSVTRFTFADLRARFWQVVKNSVVFYVLGIVLIFALYSLVSLPKPHSPAASEAEVLSGWSFAIFALTACISAPLLEEVLFRGLVQNMFRTVLRGRSERFLAARDIIAIVLTAALFALIHGTISGFPPLFVVGLMCGFAYLRTGTLWAAVGVHFVNNVVATALLLVA